MDLEQLTAYRDRNRVLLVFAPSVNGAKYLEQRAWLEAQKPGFDERDLLAFHFLPGEAVSVREHFSVPKDSFTVVLIGKDGSEKERYSEPVQLKVLFDAIDQMPMRRREMAERGKS